MSRTTAAAGADRAPTTPGAGRRGASDRGAWRWWLVGMLVLALALRVWLLPHRWVNPDEGAHLMDGLMALEGLIPKVDFGSRQVLYVFANSAVIAVLGTDLFLVRIFPAVLWVSSGLFVFLIARDLFDRRVGLLAAGLFLILPFPLVMSVNAKTQPLTLLCETGAVFALVRGLRLGPGEAGPRRGAVPWMPFLAAGLALGVGYHVRQSSLAVVLAILLALQVAYRTDLGRLARAVGIFGGGFAVVAVGVMAVYARHVPLAEVWASGLNPLFFVFERLGASPSSFEGRFGTLPLLPLGALGAPAELAAALAQQEAWRTLGNLREALYLNGVLLVGAALSLPAAWLAAGRRGSGLEATHRGDADGPGAPWRLAYGIPALWAGCLALAYAYYAVDEAFYQAYVLELLAPLAILTAAAALAFLRALRDGRPGGRDLLALGTVLALFAGLAVIVGPEALNRPLYLVLAAVGLAPFYLSFRGGWRGWAAAALALGALSAGAVVPGPELPGPARLLVYGLLGAATYALLFAFARVGVGEVRRAVAFVSYTLLVAALALTQTAAVDRVDLAYDAVWSPDAVRTVGNYLERTSEPGDRVLSGAMVWEFQAGRLPYRNVSHPLGWVREGLPTGPAAAIAEDLARRPPEFVVTDRYARRIYLQGVPRLRELLERRYERVEGVEAAMPLDTVRVYRLRSASSDEPPEPSPSAPR